MWSFHEYIYIILFGGILGCFNACVECSCLASLRLVVTVMSGLNFQPMVLIYSINGLYVHIFSDGNGGEYVMAISKIYKVYGI